MSFPIPKVSLSMMMGLLEALEDAGGETDVAQLALDFDLEIDDIKPILDAAEMLGFVTVDGGDVKMTDLCYKLVGAKIQERKIIFRDQLTKVPLFQELTEIFAKSGGKKLAKKDVLEFLSKKVSPIQADEYFDVIVNWGRYSQVLSYHSETEELVLRV